MYKVEETSKFQIIDGEVVKVYELLPGTDIKDVALELVYASAKWRQPCGACFNGVWLIARDNMSAHDVVAKWRSDTEIARKKYREEHAGEISAREAAAAVEEAERRASFDFMIAAAPLDMDFVNEEELQMWIHANQCRAYAWRSIEYAHEWARLIEGAMSRNCSLEQAAQIAADTANYDGITGFMYGIAVIFLSKFWRYGDQLRRWHNNSVQLSGEGDRANETGAVLNPAVLRVG